ncbi:MAG: cell division protein FtsA, partial [Pseudomonadota bacterium]|nr:cell division protein FtsA [Pseudomonadota bacterium]
MKKGLAKSRSGIVAALDIGSTKICCFIARTHDGGPAPLIGINHATAARPRVIGVGHQVSKGVKSGVIVDMEAAETSILTA